MSVEIAKKAYKMAWDAYWATLVQDGDFPRNGNISSAIGPMAAEIYRQHRRAEDLMDEPRWLDPNKASYVWTIGYGISTQEEFVRRLKVAFPYGDAIIVDIRKANSGSRNAGTWANWGEGMQKTVGLSGNKYMSLGCLANPYGGTKEGLKKYELELDRGMLRPVLNALVTDLKDNPETQYCLMCSERKPYAWTGHANCHRVIVAANITARMHYDHNLKWFTKHLYTEASK